uniref:Putative secreted protein n=1 Tax=Ixodes ricinus TaxID=34613 RepID=A0A6B0U327_IXORI
MTGYLWQVRSIRSRTMFIFLVFVLSRCAVQCWLAQPVKNKFSELLGFYHLMHIGCYRCCLYTTATGGALGYLEKTDSYRTAS